MMTVTTNNSNNLLLRIRINFSCRVDACITLDSSLEIGKISDRLVNLTHLSMLYEKALQMILKYGMGLKVVYFKQLLNRPFDMCLEHANVLDYRVLNRLAIST
jgi:hypothetical protein